MAEEILKENATIKETKEFFKEKLKEALELLPQRDRLIVEFPKTLNKYICADPKGALLILYGKGNYHNSSKVIQHVKLDKDRTFTILIVSKRFDEGLQPEDYVELVVDTLGGCVVVNNRPDKKIIPVEDSFIEEDEKDFWWYGVEVLVPQDFIEKSLRK